MPASHSALGVVLLALPAAGQALRALHAPGLLWATFDPHSQRTVAIGYDGVTHEFDGVAWHARPDFDAGQGMPWFPPGSHDPQILTTGYYPAFHVSQRHGHHWHRLPNAAMPAYRLGVALVHDVARGHILAFGGSLPGSSGALAETWTFDGTAWTPRAGMPDHLGYFVDSSFAPDPGGNGVLSFGGHLAAPNGDLRAFRNGAWTTLSTTGPAPRTQHTMWTQNGATYVFGGADANWTPLADTWRWNGSSWTQLATMPAPSARVLARAVFAPGLGHALLCGGYGTGPVADTWTFDGAQWTVTTTTVAPSSPMSLAYDPIRNRAIAFSANAGSGTTWEWNGTQWQTIATAHRPWTNGPMAFDPTRGRVVLAGDSNQPDPGLLFWSYDGIDWSRLSVLGDADSTAPVQDSGRAATNEPNGGFVLATAQGLFAIVADAAATLDLGAPCGPVAGTLRARQAARLGNQNFALDVVGLRVGQPTLLVAGNQPTSLPLLGCKLLVGGTLHATFALANGHGVASFPVPIPPTPALNGFDVYWQAIFPAANLVPLSTTAGVGTRLGN